ncbi:hypothetical protein BK010_10495 (plasmid) [Tenericutes bacterium MO-XQ]|nr:hypothetical protein BK010_10495 [Tenericutes bacterium MO-XQ]
MKYYENVLKAINYYIQDEDLNNAFFLNGRWGSGKSYFVKNVLNEYLKTEFEHKLIYISLYGIVSVEEIAKQIYSKLIAESRISKHKTKTPRFSKSMTVEYAKDTAMATAKNLIPMLLSKVYITLPKIENYWKYITMQKIVLIFDDLERSRIDIIELMGYINNFVEEYGIKTIVVGNETEIRKKFYVDDFIEKIGVVKDLKLPISIDKDKDKYRASLYRETEVTEKVDNGMISTNLNTLSKKVEYMFSTHEQYDKIKEKLIGYTFEFDPPISELFKILSNDDIIERNLNFIERIYHQRSCSNLRTFIFSKHAFKQLRDKIGNLELENIDDLFDIIVENIFYNALNLKNPLDKLNENQFGTIISTTNNVPQFVVDSINKELDKYLISLEIDIDLFKISLSAYDKLISEYKFETENSLQKLQTYWLDKDDDYIKDAMSEILEMLNQNTLNIQIYPTLISHIYLYNDIFDDTKLDVDNTLQIMYKNIDNNDAKIEQDFGINMQVTYWPEQKEEMENILNLLHEKIKEHNLTISDQSINTYLTNDNWSQEFIDNLKDEKKAWRFTTEYNFVSLIDVEKLAELILSGTPKDLSNVQQAFRFVYSFSNLNEYFKNDLENLKKMREILNKGLSDVESKVMIYSVKKFILYLEEKINIISIEKK